MPVTVDRVSVREDHWHWHKLTLSVCNQPFHSVRICREEVLVGGRKEVHMSKCGPCGYVGVLRLIAVWKWKIPADSNERFLRGQSVTSPHLWEPGNSELVI